MNLYTRILDGDFNFIIIVLLFQILISMFLLSFGIN